MFGISKMCCDAINACAISSIFTAQCLHCTARIMTRVVKWFYWPVCTFSGLYGLKRSFEVMHTTQKCKLIHTGAHTHTHILCNTQKWLHTHTHTHVDVPQVWHPNKFAHVLIRSPSIPQISAGITYRTFSFSVPLTCLCISRLLRSSAAPHLTSQHSSL